VAITIDDIYLRDGGLCGICGEPVKLKQASVDHIIPRSKGGKDCQHNTQTTHWDCNRRKRAKMPEVLPEPCGCVYIPPQKPLEDEFDKRIAPASEGSDKAERAAKLQHEGKPNDVAINFSIINENGSPCAAVRMVFPDQKTWTYGMSLQEIDRLLSSLHSVHAIARSLDFQRWWNDKGSKE
jgi:hypothetical protein